MLHKTVYSKKYSQHIIGYSLCGRKYDLQPCKMAKVPIFARTIYGDSYPLLFMFKAICGDKSITDINIVVKNKEYQENAWYTPSRSVLRCCESESPPYGDIIEEVIMFFQNALSNVSREICRIDPEKLTRKLLYSGFIFKENDEYI